VADGDEETKKAVSVGPSGPSEPPQSPGAPGREPSGSTRSAPAYSRRRALGLIAGGLGLAVGAAVVDTLGGPGTIGTGQVVPYPRIDSLGTSSVFRVFAGDQEIWTEEFARTRTIHVANFAATGPVPIRIEVDTTVRSVRVSPRHRGPAPWWQGKAVRFTVDGHGPRKLIVFVTTTSGRQDPLYLLIDEPEVNPPTGGADHLTFFGPGTHQPGDITLNTDDTLYLAPGALVIGRIVARDAAGISIRGRGILQEPDESSDPNALEDEADFYTIRMDACPNVHVEGITIRDIPRGWTLRYDECDHLVIQGVKIFSFKVNGDGIDPNGCQDVTIENCLVSTGDDAVVIKSTEGSKRNVSGVTVRGCVLETYPKTTAGEGGDALKIGTETYCPDMSAILFQDCDIVRAHGGMAFSINHRDQARIHDVQFTDIRVEADVENENFGIVMRDSGPGTVSDITLRNVAWTARRDIVLKGQGISGVRFENCTVAGEPLADVKVVDGAQAPTISP
jgi:glycosyl hydrolase family 28